MRVHMIYVYYTIASYTVALKYERRDRRPIRYEIEKSVISGSRPQNYTSIMQYLPTLLVITVIVTTDDVIIILF